MPRQTRSRVVVLVLLAAPALTWLALTGLPYTLLYPTVVALAPGGLRLEVHPAGVATLEDCQLAGNRVAGPMRAASGAQQLDIRVLCHPGWQVAPDALATGPALLGHQPLSVPAARTADGTVLTYRAEETALAAAVCAQAAAAATAALTCVPAGQWRP